MVDLTSPAPFVGEFEARRVQRMLAKLLVGKLGQHEAIAVSGWRDGDWACVRWEVANADRSFCYPIDARVDVRTHRMREADAKDVLYDFLGHFVTVWLAEREQPFTGPKWEAVDFMDRKLWVRGQIVNERDDRRATELIAAAARAEAGDSGGSDGRPSG